MSQTTRFETRDILLFLVVGIALAAIHYGLPVTIQNQLAFNHANPSPWAVFTAAYVHNSTRHLVANLAGFGIGVAVAYTLCELQGCRRWFRTTTVSFLIVLPVLVSLTSYLAFQSIGLEPTSRGFSGVVAGYGSFILVALARWTADRYGIEVGIIIGEGVLLLLLAELAIIYTGKPSLLVSALLVVGLGLLGGSLLRRGIEHERSAIDWRHFGFDVAFVGLIVILLCLFVYALFPAEIAASGLTVNIIAHGAGFVWGGVVSIGLNVLGLV